MQKHSVIDQLIPSKSYKNPRHTDIKRKEIENKGKTIRGLQHWETEEDVNRALQAARPLGENQFKVRKFNSH